MSQGKRKNKLTSALLSSLIIGGIFSMSSCGGKEKKEEVVNDTLPIAVETPDTVVQSVDSARTYYSDDLRSFGIRGDVKARSSIRHDAGVVYPIPTMELTFDSVGNFTGSLQGLYPKNNDEGFGYLYSMNEGDGTSWELTYTEVNDKNYPLKAEIIESGPQGTAKAELTYYGYEYDKEGNWVMRCATMNREFIETETEEKTSTFHKWRELVSYTYYDRAAIDPSEENIPVGMMIKELPREVNQRPR